MLASKRLLQNIYIYIYIYIYNEREIERERERERKREREREGIQLFSMLEQRTAGRWLLFIPSQASRHPKTENN